MPINQSSDFLFQWHLTERCNLSCSHCYQEKGRAEEISTAEALDIIEEIAETVDAWSQAYDIEFTPSFNVTGGEPLLRRDLFGILDEIGKRGFEIYLLTNGILIDREKARRIAEIGVRGVQVSIEGPEGIHEAIRGAGSFSASVTGVRNLLEAGMTVTLNATLSEMNADAFPEMIGLAQGLGVQRLGFSRLVPSGRGKEILHKMLPKERVKELYEKIVTLDTEGLKIVTGDPVASRMSSVSEESVDNSIPSGGCAAGVSGLTILPDGTLTPCRRLPIPIGNVTRDSLREVWALSPVLNALRDKGSYGGKCGKCGRWADCRGCRAIAYSYSLARGAGDYLAEDPQCFLEG